ncbi:MAG: sulfate reduction electron transfer complex DsrMKJOP subunit DsrM [Syntrophorhabdaceae bacterium]|nr:sulfate reduction electron transfer complex DsrMKJOP subunit DsrM [Syntrophorhabdaceae bacterium]
MPVLYASLLTLFLILIPGIGIGLFNMKALFGIVVLYGAFLIFISGVIYRVIIWAKSPVPFSIPTVCGQAKSLPWIRQNKIESPHTSWGVIKRMLLEVLFFRSLLRNEKGRLKTGGRLLFYRNLLLWFGGVLFHWSLFIIIIRHLRLFLEPVPSFVEFIYGLDGLFELFTPPLLITDLLILLGIIYLFFRRLFDPQTRYISISTDYFPLMLIFAIVITGLLIRHVQKVDIMGIKAFLIGLFSFNPSLPKESNTIFYIHLFLVATLLSYLPFSKLIHMAGVFFSPTRNLKNSSRMERHINPWDYPVLVHTYEEWEDEFRAAMKDVGLPVEKEN